MSEPKFNLRKPPIVEAVLDFECDFVSGRDIASIEEVAKQKLQQSYPTVRTQFVQQFRIEAKLDGAVDHSASHGVQALQFFQEDEKQIVQVRRTGYSFNRLAPYASFDDYLPEIRRTWEVYCEIAAPLQVKSITLRYINRIHIPLLGGRVRLEDYFTVGPRLPDEDRLTCVGFLNQFTAEDRDTGHRVTTVLTAEQPTHDSLPMIFDNTVAAQVGIEIGNWGAIEAILMSLRALKNHVFKNTVTDKCLSLFQ